MASLSTWEFVNLGQVVFQGQLNQLFLYWSLTGTWGVGGGGGLFHSPSLHLGS